MALSGSFYKNVDDGGYRLKGEWSATQNISDNTSTITLKMYWMSLSSYHSVYSSDPKNGRTVIDGTTDNHSGLSAKLSTNQEKQIGSTQTKTVTHDSDGTKSISLGVYFDAEVRLGGTFYSTISATDTVTLNTIPRASTLSSSASFTAGSSLKVSIARKSSSFTHTVRVLVNGTLITTEYDVEGSRTISFTDAEKKKIFTELAQSSSKGCEIEVLTYKGGTKIGSTYSKTGTCTAPTASLATANTFNIGSSVGIGIDRENSGFTHRIVASSGGFSATVDSSATTSATWDTAVNATALLATIPDKTYATVTLTCTTYFDGVQVRSPRSSTVKANVSGYKPVFSTFNHIDNNPTTATMTGNLTPPVLIRNKSKLRVIIPVNDRAKTPTGSGTTMKEYIASVNDKEVKKTWSNTADVIFDLDLVNSATDVKVYVKAIDNRGNYYTVTKTVKMVDYVNPLITISAKRNNSFDTTTVLAISGSYSPVAVNGVNKNIISSLEYRSKPTTAPSFGSTWTPIPFTTSGNKYTGTKSAELDQTQAHNLEVRLVDKFTGTSGVVEIGTVAAGRPIMFIDSVRKSVGINTLPTANEALEVNRIVMSANSWATSNGGGIDMQNSDMIGLNGAFFKDIADNDGEGLQFLKTGKASGSGNIADYDSFRILDGTAFLNSKPVFMGEQTELWAGSSYLEAGTSIKPTKKLSDCPNGWLLIWSDYDYGAGTNDYDFVFSVVPKSVTSISNGRSMFIIPNFAGDAGQGDQYINKIVYIYNDRLEGHLVNNQRKTASTTAGGWDGTVDRTDVVLRRVLPF